MNNDILMIDLDNKNEEEINRFLWALGILKDYVPFKDVIARETRKGFHIYIKTANALNPTEIMLYQQLLGSDRNRELFNFIRFKRGHKKWQVLFKRKYAKWDNDVETSQEEITQKALEIELLAKLTILEKEGK